MKRKILNILLIGALVIGLTGCGKNSEKKDTEQKSNEQEKGEIKEDITEQKKIGDTISLDFVEVTLDKLEVKNNYKFRREEKTSYGTNIRNASIEPETSDFKLVTLRGNFTNKTSGEVYTDNKIMYGIFEINGSKYSTTFAGFNTAEANRFFSIKPQQKVEYFLYAEVPSNVADNIETCKIKFGFQNDLNSFILDLNDLDYIYELNEIPTK